MYDSHAHLQFEEFEKDREDVIKECKNNGLRGVINVGIDYQTSLDAINLSNQYKDFCFTSIGVHPINAHKEDFNEGKFLQLSKQENVVAIGEIGLDYYHSENYKKEQKEILEKQLDFAIKLDLPVIFHCRGSKDNPLSAYNDLFEILNEREKKIRGVIHCFSADLNLAQKFINEGFYIGINGPITFKNAWPRLINTVENISLNKILVETDCPYLTPEPYRGDRNKPWYIKFVLEKIANLKEKDFDIVKNQTIKNSKTLFNI